MHPRPFARALVGLILVSAPVLSACGNGGGEVAAADAQAFVAGDGSIVTVAPDDRQPAPDISGTTLAGDEFTLSEHRGEVVVLNVWASWCAPCRSEAPALAEVARETRKQPVQFAGLVTRDSETTARAFAERFALDYPHVVDTDGRLQLQFRDTLPPQAIPSTVVVDSEGRVAARVLGEVSAAGLRSILEPLVAEASQ